MEVIVEKVSMKQSGVKLCGKWYDWPRSEPLPRAGELLNVEIEGKRIVYASLIDAASIQTPQAPPPTSSALDPKEVRIVRENVLARAVELEIAGKLDTEGDTRTTSERLFAAAEQLERWVLRGD